MAAPEEVAAKAAPLASGGEALVAFFTKLPDKYKVKEDPLVVPATLARYGLSEVVNRLLSFDKPVPFDFLIDGEFLRSDLGAYLEGRKLSSEKVLKLEYVLALSEPEQTQVDEVPDWISGIVALGPLPSRWFAASAYDGTVRLYEAGSGRLSVRMADVALTSIAALPTQGGQSSCVAAPSKDGAVYCCQLRHGPPAAAGAVAGLRGPEHRKASEAAAINEDGTLLAGAGWDQDVLVWNSGPAVFAEPPPPAEESGAAGKRKAGADQKAEVAKFVLKGHSQVVSCLQFGAQARYPFTLLSGSWDGSVRVWDVAAASCVCNWAVARAVTSFSMSPGSPPQMATSHEDGHVSLWDIRAAAHPGAPGALSLDASAGLPLASAQAPHRRLTSQVAWCPLDDYRIASVGHDGYLCVLDPRSPRMPLQRLRLGKPGPVPTKLLCACWLARDELAVGGSDGKVVRVGLAQGRPVAEEA